MYNNQFCLEGTVQNLDICPFDEKLYSRSNDICIGSDRATDSYSVIVGDHVVVSADQRRRPPGNEAESTGYDLVITVVSHSAADGKCRRKINLSFLLEKNTIRKHTHMTSPVGVGKGVPKTLKENQVREVAILIL